MSVHVSRPEEPLCYNCGANTHWAVACPEPTRATPAGLAAWRAAAGSQSSDYKSFNGASKKTFYRPFVSRYGAPFPAHLGPDAVSPATQMYHQPQAQGQQYPASYPASNPASNSIYPPTYSPYYQPPSSVYPPPTYRLGPNGYPGHNPGPPGPPGPPPGPPPPMMPAPAPPPGVGMTKYGSHSPPRPADSFAPGQAPQFSSSYPPPPPYRMPPTPHTPHTPHLNHAGSGAGSGPRPAPNGASVHAQKPATTPRPLSLPAHPSLPPKPPPSKRPHPESLRDQRRRIDHHPRHQESRTRDPSSHSQTRYHQHQHPYGNGNGIANGNGSQPGSQDAISSYQGSPRSSPRQNLACTATDAKVETEKRLGDAERRDSKTDSKPHSEDEDKISDEADVPLPKIGDEDVPLPRNCRRPDDKDDQESDVSFGDLGNMTKPYRQTQQPAKREPDEGCEGGMIIVNMVSEKAGTKRKDANGGPERCLKKSRQDPPRNVENARPGNERDLGILWKVLQRTKRERHRDDPDDRDDRDDEDEDEDADQTSASRGREPHRQLPNKNKNKSRGSRNSSVSSRATSLDSLEAELLGLPSRRSREARRRERETRREREARSKPKRRRPVGTTNSAYSRRW